LARVRIAAESVCIPLAAPACANSAGSLTGNPVPESKEHLMADVIFVGITIAFFGLLALIVKGVERLER
jgi:hypothetical protein